MMLVAGYFMETQTDNLKGLNRHNSTGTMWEQTASKRLDSQTGAQLLTSKRKNIASNILAASKIPTHRLQLIVRFQYFIL